MYVLPADGGKIWGAIEKSTGKEFIYRNEVIKYRNISMRGPWTSGGIEFNFGYIGHHPSTCVPVDYKIVENADGSVSCFVGSLDLSSRTKWCVEVKPWPEVTKGRDRSMYVNNDFGSSSSFHVVGEYNDFIGGYYHKSRFGFGHWALYDEMP